MLSLPFPEIFFFIHRWSFSSSSFYFTPIKQSSSSLYVCKAWVQRPDPNRVWRPWELFFYDWFPNFEEIKSLNTTIGKYLSLESIDSCYVCVSGKSKSLIMNQNTTVRIFHVFSVVFEPIFLFFISIFWAEGQYELPLSRYYWKQRSINIAVFNVL